MCQALLLRVNSTSFNHSRQHGGAEHSGDCTQRSYPLVPEAEPDQLCVPAFVTKLASLFYQGPRLFRYLRRFMLVEKILVTDPSLCGLSNMTDFALPPSRDSHGHLSPSYKCVPLFILDKFFVHFQHGRSVFSTVAKRKLRCSAIAARPPLLNSSMLILCSDDISEFLLRGSDCQICHVENGKLLSFSVRKTSEEVPLLSLSSWSCDFSVSISSLRKGLVRFAGGT